MRSFKAQTSSLLVLALMLAPGFAFADKKEDFYQTGVTAIKNGKAVEARDAFCAAAKEDPDYKDAKAQCASLEPDAKAVINAHNKRYVDAMTLKDKGDFDGAEKLLLQVRYGEYVDRAKQQLKFVAQEKQKKADQDAAKAGADADTIAKNRFDEGVTAFNRGDFGGARNAFSASGKYQADAASYVTRMNNYDQKMNEAASLVAAKNNAAAISAYTEAARIHPSGPGDPSGKSQLLSASVGGSPAVPAPAKPTTTASKDTVKTVDIPKTLADAKRAVARSDFKRARILFNDVMAVDYRNAEAIAGINALPADQSASAGKEDAQLAGLIRLYFDGRYEEAEEGFKFYLFSEKKDKKMGLANFFQGASLLSRYYLNGGTEEKLMQDAKLKFKDAKAVDGFNAPAKFVSPKIMKVFNAS